MPTSPIVQILLLVATGVCLLALWKGGPTERIGAGIILANLIFDLFGSPALPAEFRPTLRLVMDALTASCLLALTMWYASLWLGAAMLLFAAQFTLHSYYFVTNRPPDYFHAMVNNLNYLGVIMCLAVGTAVSWRWRVADRRAAEADAEAHDATATPAA